MAKIATITIDGRTRLTFTLPDGFTIETSEGAPEPGYPKTLRGVYGSAIGQPDRVVNNHNEEADARVAGFTDDPQAIKIAGLS